MAGATAARESAALRHSNEQEARKESSPVGALQWHVRVVILATRPLGCSK